MNPTVGVLLLLPLVLASAVPVWLAIERVEAAQEAGSWAQAAQHCQDAPSGHGCVEGRPVPINGHYCRLLELPANGHVVICDLLIRANKTVGDVSTTISINATK